MPSSDNYEYLDASSNSSKISTSTMKNILQNLQYTSTRKSTKAIYLSVWQKFNSFIIKLDNKPSSWEERITLFGAYLVDSGVQSGTLKSYYSAIKSILREDGYIVDHEKLLLVSLTKACKLISCI